MGFVRIFWKNNVQEAYLPKMSISGQIVSEIVVQLCLENSIQTLLNFFGSTQKRLEGFVWSFLSITGSRGMPKNLNLKVSKGSMYTLVDIQSWSRITKCRDRSTHSIIYWNIPDDWKSSGGASLLYQVVFTKGLMTNPNSGLDSFSVNCCVIKATWRSGMGSVKPAHD